jgi:uncharacterized protein YndB with AHSA1/START domain
VKARRSRSLDVPAERIWELVSDPYMLPRWWPRVSRVEQVDADAWSTILQAPRGRDVRADWRLVASEAPVRRRWAQELAGSPFATLFVMNEVELRLDGAAVTVEIEQRVRGWARLVPWMVRRAARKVADEALDGIEAAL